MNILALAVILVGNYAGFKIGWHFMDRWLERRASQRRIINITPRVKRISGDR